MQISLRSQLIAGTAAVVGASAIAMTPVTTAHMNLPTVKVPSAAQVALAGFDSPISELLDTLTYINFDLFNGDSANVDDNLPWSPYGGMLPEFIYTALPVISQLGYNGANYIENTLGAVNDSAWYLSEGVWNLPGEVLKATKQLLTGQFAAALATLTAATIDPIKAAVTSLIGAGTYLVSNIVTNLTNVLATVPGIAKGLLNTTVGLVKATINAVVEITKQTFAAITGGNFELAYNTVVDGLFGPVGADGLVTSSIPGVLETLTIGPGIGPIAPTGQGNGYNLPSLRTWGEGSQLTIANALGSTWPVASVVPGKAAAVRAARVAAPAAAAVAAAPAADNASETAGDNVSVSRPAAGADTGATTGAADSDNGAAAATAGSASSPKPVKRGASRNAARAAAAAAK